MSDRPPAVASWRDQIERLSPHALPLPYCATLMGRALGAPIVDRPMNATNINQLSEVAITRCNRVRSAPEPEN
jgi:hypothetical protein